jgi:hypothetical protein
VSDFVSDYQLIIPDREAFEGLIADAKAGHHLALHAVLGLQEWTEHFDTIGALCIQCDKCVRDPDDLGAYFIAIDSQSENGSVSIFCVECVEGHQGNAKSLRGAAFKALHGCGIMRSISNESGHA